MKIGEVWEDKEDKTQVRILEINDSIHDEVLYEYIGKDAINYCSREDFVESYKKKY